MFSPASGPRLGDTAIEIHTPPPVRGRIRHAVFDFDGTLSLIRAGWQAVMRRQFVDELARTPTSESRDELAQVCDEFISRLTGRQTIYQMLQLEEEVRRRGGTPKTALEYKHHYLALLGDKISDKLAGLKSGRENPEVHRVPGSLTLLQGLASRNVTCYLASGTDHPCVVEEAALLGLTQYFAGGIYGARDDYKSFSKRKLIGQILERHGLSGEELVGFGDGYVEIENTRQAGGIAIGIASQEEAIGTWDDWKRQRLLSVGAHLLVADWRRAEQLLAYLWDEGSI